MDEINKLPFKNGATFQYTFGLRAGRGAITSLDGITVASCVKTADGAIYSCNVVVSGDKRSFTATYIGSTKGWPIGDAVMDVKFVRQSDGLIQYSDNLEIKVYKSITL